MKEIQQFIHFIFFNTTIYDMIQQNSCPLHYQRFFSITSVCSCQFANEILARAEDADVFLFCPLEKCVNFVPSDIGIPEALWQMPKDIVRMPVKNLTWFGSLGTRFRKIRANYNNVT